MAETKDKNKPKIATSEQGTTYTQVNDSTYNWAGRSNGYGTIHLNPNSGEPWGTYHIYQGSAGPDIEKKLSQEGLYPHVQNIKTLKFDYPDKWWVPIKEYIAPRWNGLLDKAKIKKQGGYLEKYSLGGATQQLSLQEEEKGLMTLIDSAYKEVVSGKPGDSFVYVAQLLLDAEAMVKIDALKAKNPEIEDKLNAIEEVAVSNSMYMKKGGCAKKKKVKKGAKGCVPCKKLMKIGGRLVNVLTDCEGNIISKHLAGGWIPKADKGTELLERLRQALLKKNDMNWLNQLDATVTANLKYYTKDGKLYLAKGKLTNGTWSWDTSGDEIAGATLNNGVWSLNGQTINTVAHDALGTDYYTGATHQIYDPTTGKYFNYSANGTGWTKGAEATADDFTSEDYYEGTNMTNWTISPEKAKEHGIDASAFAGPRPKKRGVYGDASNSLLGLEARDPDGTDYINQFGVLGAWARENSIMLDKFNEAWRDRRTALQSARQSRKDKNTDNDVTRASVINGYKNYKAKLNTERSNHAAAISDAIRAKWAGWDPGVYATQTKAKVLGDTDLLVGEKSTVPKSDKGGWLSKFDNGGKNSDLIQGAARNSEWSGYNLPYEAYSFAKNGKLDKANILFTKIGDRSYEWTVPGTNGAYDMYTASRDAASLPWDIKKMSYTGLLPALPVTTHYYAAIPYTYPPTGGYVPKESPALFMNYMVPVKM